MLLVFVASGSLKLFFILCDCVCVCVSSVFGVCVRIYYSYLQETAKRQLDVSFVAGRKRGRGKLNVVLIAQKNNVACAWPVITCGYTRTYTHSLTHTYNTHKCVYMCCVLA